MGKAIIVWVFGVRMAWIRQYDGTYTVEQRNFDLSLRNERHGHTRAQLRTLANMGLTLRRGPVVPSADASFTYR